MKSFITFFVFISLIAAPRLGFSAVPRVTSTEQCEVLAGYALVVRALAKNGVKTAKIPHIMADTYQLNSKNGQEIARLLNRKAELDNRTPHQFSVDFGVMCIEKQGDISKFFGTNT